MDIKKLQAIVIDALEDVKAQDIKVFETSHLTSLFDRIAVASGTSNRQTKALASSVREKVKESGGNVLSVEGEDTGEWVLVDLGDMIVHIMQPAIRAYYRLEEIWGEKEVKFGAAKRTGTAAAKKASDVEDAPKKATGRHLTTSKTTVDEAPAKAPRKTSTRAKVGTDGAAPAKRKPAPSKAVGKTIKVAAPKSGAAPKKAPAKRKTAA
ncbi:MAG TPA: ribosome silencing factor [Burkholderiaceae bacterium]|jgi:ribosome-associated protein